jgi:parallel beta-helix repeat protein
VNGTANDPVKFIGYLPNVKGVWKGVMISSGNPETNINYCIFDGAGSGTLGIKEENTSLLLGDSYISRTGRGSVTNCTFSNSGGYGISYRLTDSITLKNNTFKDNTKADVFNIK